MGAVSVSTLQNQPKGPQPSYVASVDSSLMFPTAQFGGENPFASLLPLQSVPTFMNSNVSVPANTGNVIHVIHTCYVQTPMNDMTGFSSLSVLPQQTASFLSQPDPSLSLPVHDTMPIAHQPASHPINPIASLPKSTTEFQIKTEIVTKSRPVGAPSKGRSRRNAEPLFWTPTDHAKFVRGLEKFGLTEGLGPNGAELMAMYMGNRTRSQIRSHAQKHFSDMAKLITE